MPDIKLWYASDVPMEPHEFKSLFMEVVARQLSCKDEDGEHLPLDPKTNIDFTVFDELAGPATVKVIIEIAGYAYLDRMRNLNNRLELIAEWVRDDLGLEPGSVSITFIKVEHDCWIKV